MATATKKASVPPASSGSAPQGALRVSPLQGLSRVIDAIYRFLASLKLAVISLSSLAAALALRDLLRVVVRDCRGAGVRLPEHRVRGPAGVPGHQHPLRGPDPLPLEEAADGIRDHARRGS